MHFAYILKLENGKLYIGYTSNLDKRIREHEKRWQIEVNLLYFEAYSSESLARTREKKLKHYGSAWRALKQRIKA